MSNTLNCLNNSCTTGSGEKEVPLWTYSPSLPFPLLNLLRPSLTLPQPATGSAMLQQVWGTALVANTCMWYFEPRKRIWRQQNCFYAWQSSKRCGVWFQADQRSAGFNPYRLIPSHILTLEKPKLSKYSLKQQTTDQAFTLNKNNSTKLMLKTSMEV